MAGKRKFGSSQTQQQKAYWANKRFGKKSWDSFGAARILRGSDFSLSSFGPSWKEANQYQKANRREAGFTGRGLYTGMGKYGIRRTLGKFAKKQHIGKHLYDAGVAGAVAGATLGPEAVVPAMAAGYTGAGLYTGRGSYCAPRPVNKNVLFKKGRPAMQYIQGSGDNQEVIITHHEYLRDVYGPANSQFKNDSIEINPGLAENFPWLSQLADNYEEYELLQLVYEFRSTVDASATNNTSGATGTIIMATNYNPDAPKFAGKEAMMQYHGSASGRLTDNLIHGVECDPQKNAGTSTKYIRVTKPTITTSLKDFDLGKFQFALVNIPSGFENQQVGELWVSYSVKLGKPRLNVSLYRNLPLDRWVWDTTGTFAFGPEREYDVPASPKVIGANYIQYTAQNRPFYQNITGTALTVSNGFVADLTGNTQNAYPTTVYTLTFPAFMTSTFNIKALLQCLVGTATTGLTNIHARYFRGGNVSSLELQQGQYLGAQTQPRMFSQTHVGNNYNRVADCFVAITPATAGVDNTLALYVQDQSALDSNIFAECSNMSLTMEPINATMDRQVILANGTVEVTPLADDPMGLISAWPLM